MPNWCNNFVEITNDDPQLISQLKDAMEKGEFCNYVIPVPKELQETVAGFSSEEGFKEKQEAQHKHNLETYGYKDWYDFCVGSWGTKWDISEAQPSVDDDGKLLSCGFDTAWSPPIGVYQALVEKGFHVKAYYYEPGMGFCGMIDDDHEEYYDLGTMGPQQVANALPQDLDQMFSISEEMFNYEEDQRMDEDLYRWVKESSEEKKVDPA